ncbi:hypothetical protein K491DRAFT_610728 [Lophiostoma macrostomum CBS 122681]|uniref:Amino acid permease/ SLC12A domain-containing protein n=1 Tax=Lophiostoma macrostomum CBS 122681 TaxID=1314788 RepID=A0A6A6SNJ9_9PLEO|nr:hypothetical protein K491DRAFT_610728 [Lophiostoma macrostomum CBS 122681]
MATDAKKTATELSRSESIGVGHVQETKRGLSPRHLQLMTIAGGIGVGLFVGVGGVLRVAGPINLILGYLFYGCVFMWPLSLMVGEMVAWLPIRGSIYELASHFVDPALGFAMGWTYFFAGAMVVCTEYSAVATVIGYWDSNTNPAAWVAMSIAVCYILNMFAVRWFGESEFVMASTKVLLLLGLVLITFITMVGGNPRHDAYGFRNWTNGKAMHPYYATGATGRFLGFCAAVRYAVFTIGGPDFVSLAAGEIQNPRRTVPRVAKMILVRILTFYVVGIIAVGIICPSDDKNLFGAIENGSVGSAASPWVIGIARVGIESFLPGFINFLIMLSGLSCGNAFLYSASRTLYSLAQDGHAPRVLLKCNKSGVPWVCVSVVTAISLLTFLVSSHAASDVFGWFLDLTTVSLVVNFTAMGVVFVAWYRALQMQGYRRIGIVFPYVSPFAPYTAYMIIVIGSIVSLGIGFDVFAPFSYRGFITSYFGLAWFVLAFALFKIVKRSKLVDPKTVDIFMHGRKQDIDAECRFWEDATSDGNEKVRLARMNAFVRAWERFWGV